MQFYYWPLTTLLETNIQPFRIFIYRLQIQQTDRITKQRSLEHNVKKKKIINENVSFTVVFIVIKILQLTKKLSVKEA